MIEKMNEYLRTIGSHYATTDGVTFKTIIPSSDRLLVLIKRFETIEEASSFIFSLKARA